MLRDLKQAAANKAVQEVRSGMVVGLGGGSTAALAHERLAELIAAGELGDVQGVPCSKEVAALGARLGIPLISLEEHQSVDLTIDGADEVDVNCNLIKGGGGALLREKIVAQASERLIIVVDETKLSPALGYKRMLPVEVLPFGWRTQMEYLRSVGGEAFLRLNRERAPFVSDNGNYILDWSIGPIVDPFALARRLEGKAGIVGHGLFLGMADEVIVAHADGLQVLKGEVA